MNTTPDDALSVEEGPSDVSPNWRHIIEEAGVKQSIIHLVLRYAGPPFSARDLEEIEHQAGLIIETLVSPYKRGRHERRPQFQFKKYTSAEGAEVDYA